MDRGSEPDRPDEDATQDGAAVASALAALAPLTAPTTDERARMREHVLAGLAEPASGDRVRPQHHRVASGRVARASRGPRGRRGPSRGGGREDRPARALSGARGRLAVAAVAVLALVGSLTGMSLLLARDALPGDALYGFKRTGEAASLGLTFGDESKALKHLDFAGARISEIETLATRYPGQDAPIGSYLTALTDFDNDAAAGSRQLIALATRADGGLLELLGAWARQQEARLTGVALPAPVRGREAASLNLLGRIAGRADALLARMDCYQITSGSFDDVGALPATGTCERVSGSGPAPTGPDTSGTARPTTPPAPPAGTEPPTQRRTPPLPPLPDVASVLPDPTAEEPRAGTAGPSPSAPPSVELPLPLPPVEVPPLLPGLPGVHIGG
ncbi:MAG TPA: DUF5667 domain-containing protein [Actinophytocola sp.]|nr:DUF5667 domain-containing protein [Actinophytocola sp.]